MHADRDGSQDQKKFTMLIPVMNLNEMASPFSLVNLGGKVTLTIYFIYM